MSQDRNSTLCIAAPSFAAVSETFIRAHARTIHPNNTVLLCKDGRGSEGFNYPVLSNIDPYLKPRSSFERFQNALRLRYHNNFDRTLWGTNELRVREFFLQHGVTHCLAEFGPIGCLLMRASVNANVRLFVHFHGYDATALSKQISWRRSYAKLFRDAAGVVAPSHFISNKLEELGCPTEKLHVSACGINPADYHETYREVGQILAVGRFVEKKSPLTTIEAFSKIADIAPEAQLQMIGDGPLFEAAKDLVKKLNLTDRVVLHGAQPHAFVRSLLERASVFVQHSITASNGDTEGLPLAILEAMAACVPVISTRHSGIPEVLVDGETGILVEEHDATGFAEAMLDLLLNPDKARKLGRAAAPRIKCDFSHQATAARLREIMGILT